MKAAALIPEARALLADGNFCVLSVPIGDVVRSYVMWVGVAGERLIIVSPSSSLKTRAILSARQVTLLIWRASHAYDYVEMQCAATKSATGEPARTMIEHTLAMKYGGRSYPRPDIADWTLIELIPVQQRSW